MKFRGFSLSEMLIVLIVIGIITAVTAPLITIRKKIQDYEANTVKCVKTEQAADLNSTACAASIEKAQYGQENVIKALEFFVNNGIAAEQTAANSVLKQACDNGGNKACQYFVNSCIKDATNCETTDDLGDYLNLGSNLSNNSERFLVADYAKTFYTYNTNITTLVDSMCCTDPYFTLNMACYIKDITVCGNPYALTYGGDEGDEGWAVAVSDDGNYVYVGGVENSSNHMYQNFFVIKVNASSGAVLWKKTWSPKGSGASGVTTLRVSSDGNYVYAGGYFWGVDIPDGNSFIMKLNASTGVAVWQKAYGRWGQDYIWDMDLSPDGSYLYTAGQLQGYPDSAYHRIWVMKVSTSTGAVSWKKVWTPTPVSDTRGASVRVTPDGNNIYVSGFGGWWNGTNAASGVILKLDTSGSDVWKVGMDTLVYGGGNQYGYYNIALSPDGTYLYALGRLGDPDADLGALEIIKVQQSNGALVWSRYYYGPNRVYVAGSAISSDGNYLYANALICHDGGTGGGCDSALFKLNTSDASYVWGEEYGGSNDEDMGTFQNALALSPDDNYLYLAGVQKSYLWAGSEHISLIKTRTTQSASHLYNWTKLAYDPSITFRAYTATSQDIPDGSMTYNGTDFSSLGSTNFAATNIDITEGSSWAWSRGDSTVDTEKIPLGATGWTRGLQADGVPLD